MVTQGKKSEKRPQPVGPGTRTATLAAENLQRGQEHKNSHGGEITDRKG